MADFTDILRAEVLSCIRKSGLSQASIARSIGISPKHLSQALTGRAGLSPALAGRIVFACGRELRVTSVRARTAALPEENTDA